MDVFSSSLFHIKEIYLLMIQFYFQLKYNKEKPKAESAKMKSLVGLREIHVTSYTMLCGNRKKSLRIWHVHVGT